MTLEEELHKNKYEYMDHCYDGSKIGSKSIDAYMKKNQLENDYATILIPKDILAAIVSKLLNYELLLWDTNGGEGPKDNAWEVGDLYEAVHDCITDVGYKVYEKTDETPKDCNLADCYVI